jgi:hypothetical protein
MGRRSRAVVEEAIAYTSPRMAVMAWRNVVGTSIVKGTVVAAVSLRDVLTCVPDLERLQAVALEDEPLHGD